MADAVHALVVIASHRRRNAPVHSTTIQAMFRALSKYRVRSHGSSSDKRGPCAIAYPSALHLRRCH
ncbi:hypothetical protein IG631_13029 [Alternaria alternata]|nr:hypothetical protein IG631_13029 [Alternaria alternata]